jgi:hypothetical protein
LGKRNYGVRIEQPGEVRFPGRVHAGELMRAIPAAGYLQQAGDTLSSAESSWAKDMMSSMLVF